MFLLSVDVCRIGMFDTSTVFFFDICCWKSLTVRSTIELDALRALFKMAFFINRAAAEKIKKSNLSLKWCFGNRGFFRRACKCWRPTCDIFPLNIYFAEQFEWKVNTAWSLFSTYANITLLVYAFFWVLLPIPPYNDENMFLPKSWHIWMVLLKRDMKISSIWQKNQILKFFQV